MNDLNLVLQLTDDGSHTLYRQDLDETYHSHRGAIGESEHVFIQHGLEFIDLRSNDHRISILEIGFGTGLNAWLAWQFGRSRGVQIAYHGLEPFPVPSELWKNLAYTPDPAFNQLHEVAWDHAIDLDGRFTFRKVQKTLESFREDLQIDVVFYDAFAPRKQPEVWSKQNLASCYDFLVPHGILITYCAQGQFKRNLKSVGFDVETLPGALGKKEMVRAHKP